MARDFIKIDAAASIHAVALRNFIITLRQAYDQGVKVREQMNHNQDGTVFTDMEQLFGIAPGSGQAVFDLVNGTIGSMEGTFQTADAKNLTVRVG